MWVEKGGVDGLVGVWGWGGIKGEEGCERLGRGREKGGVWGGVGIKRRAGGNGRGKGGREKWGFFYREG